MQMHDLDKVYPDQFFAKGRKHLIGRSREISKRLVEILSPFETVIDVGTGIGDMVKAFTEIGIDATGIEGTRNCEKHLLCDPDDVVIHDMREVLVSVPFHDLGMCIEVCEHIEEQYTDVFIQNLAELASQWFVTISSQRGHTHYNVKPRKWWVKKFEEHGFYYDEGFIETFRRHCGEPHGGWHNRKGNLKMILDNLYFFWIQ